MFRKGREDSEESEDVIATETDEEGEVTPAQASGLVGFIGGVIVGALIGAGVALLIAPERGAVTRRRIRQKLEHASDEAMDRLEDIKDDAGRRLRRGRRRVRRLRTRVAD